MVCVGVGGVGGVWGGGGLQWEVVKEVPKGPYGEL